MNEIPDILAKIIEQKKRENEHLALNSLKAEAERQTPPLDMRDALRRQDPSQPVRLIAELKKASPSRGAFLDPKIDLLDVADVYQENGASAISVLTDEKFFHGSIDTLRAVSQKPARHIPLLRKDFIIDPIQVYQARAAGADSILLIVAAFNDKNPLIELHDLSRSLGMIPLVEVHDAKEAEIALEIPDVEIIGVNNRDLRTFEVDIERGLKLRQLFPSSIITVAESGISSAADVAPLAKAGFDAILVGEKLITAPNIAQRTRELSEVNG